VYDDAERAADGGPYDDIARADDVGRITALSGMVTVVTASWKTTEARTVY